MRLPRCYWGKVEDVIRMNAVDTNILIAILKGTEVEILIQTPQVVPPPISYAAAKQSFLKSLIERMQQNPIPLNAPRFTREMLHERR